MKRLPVLLLCLMALGACSSMPGWWPGKPEPAAPVAAKPAAPLVDSSGRPLVVVDGVTIERVEFQPGVSSVTVERMGRQAGCTGGMGAGRMTPPGPVEVYRMICEDGKTFRARCELRQCKVM